MAGKRRRTSPDVKLHRIVLFSSVLGTLINCCVLTVSAASGEWLFGHACCQLFGLLSQVLVAGSAWMIALAAIERMYRYYAPTEHPATFSEINLKILTYGIYLLLIVLHTAPLYGWGEYSNLRGNINLDVHTTFQPKPDVEKAKNSFMLTIGSPEANITCDLYNTTAVDFKPENIVNVLSTVLQSVYGCEMRIKLGVVWTLLLRFKTKDYLEMFFKEYTSGVMAERIHNELLTTFNGCGAPYLNVQFGFALQTETYRTYKDVHISFQDIGMCTLDYSSTNTTVISWIPFVIVTSVVIPYAISMVTGLVLKLSRQECRGETLFMSPACYMGGSALCLCATVPYYYINILNHNDVPVSYEMNIAFTALYFSHSMGFVMFSTCYGCWKGHVLQITDLANGANISLVPFKCNTTYQRRESCHINNV